MFFTQGNNPVGYKDRLLSPTMRDRFSSPGTRKMPVSNVLVYEDGMRT